MTSLLRAFVRALVCAAVLSGPVRADDLLIRGGTVVTADGSRRADVRVRGEVVTEIGALEPAAEERVIDATGLLILPGGVDPHVHLAPIGDLFPFADDFTSGSRAAFAGGITTVGHMAFPQGGELPLATLEREVAVIEAQALADVFVHTTIVDPTPEAIGELPGLVASGQPSIKVFMPFETFEPRVPAFLKLMRAAKENGVRVAIHCEDAHTLEYAVESLLAAGKTSLEHYTESRPVVSELVATQRAIAMAETTGASIYIVHLSSGRALEAIAGARPALPIFAETRPLYLHFTEERYAGPDGALYVGFPPIRAASDRAALWEGLANGSVDTVATDHAPWTREQKLDATLTIETPRPGVNNLQVMLPMLFSEGVGQGRLSLARFVAVTSTNAARLFGLYPQKGTIAVGSDADLVLWDPAETRIIRDEDALSNTGFSLYAGTQVTGWPRTTLRRGAVVFQDGTVRAEPGSGRLVRREPVGAK